MRFPDVGWVALVVLLLIVSATPVDGSGSAGIAVPLGNVSGGSVIESPPHPGLASSRSELRSTAATISVDSPFRILASNDTDPLTSEERIPSLRVEDGSVSVINATFSTEPIVLTDAGYTPSDLVNASLATDGYVRSFAQPIYVAYADNWTSLSDPRVMDERAFVPRYEAVDGTNTSIRYDVYAGVTPFYGPMPVRNATIEMDANGEPSIVDPDDAAVNVPEYVTYEERNRRAIARLMRYAGNGSADPDRRAAIKERAILPVLNGKPLHQTYSGGTIGARWIEREDTLIHDAYIGISRVSPGGWYRETFVVSKDNPMTTVYVPSDFWIAETPSNYSLDGSCEVCEDGNCTTKDRDYWEDFSLIGWDREKSVSVGGRSATRESAGRWTASRVASGTITATNHISVTVERTYGVITECGDDWQNTTTETVNLTVSARAPVVAVDTSDVTVNVTAIDDEPMNQLAIETDADTNVVANPLWRVDIGINDTEYARFSPWRIYPLRRYTGVRVFTEEGNRTVQTTFEPDAEYPHLYRDYVTAGEYTNSSTSWFVLGGREVGREIPPIALSENVVAPRNSTRLYAGWKGGIGDVSDRDITGTAATATDLFGNPVRVTVRTIHYTETRLSIRVSDTTVVATLTSNGRPLVGETISFAGATPEVVTTNGSGIAVANATTAFVVTRFNATDWQADREVYYRGASTSTLVPAYFDRVAGRVGDYLNEMVSNLVLVIEWITLGVFIFVMKRYYGRE